MLLRRAFSLDGRSLAAFRIAIGLLVAADALLRSRDISLMLAPDGMFPLPLLRQYLDDPWAWSLAMLVDAAWWGPFMLCLEAAAGLLLAAGCGTRVATIASWVAVVSVLRRTAPATNAGDAWLACLLFWGMFLPLASTWSWDARRGSRRGEECSTATVALVLQIAVVYLAAGLSKWNDAWLSGDAIRFAMSVHDHGTPLGEWLLGTGWLARPVSWAVLALELLGPVLLLAWPAPRVRTSLVVLFMLFHLVSCATMTVGLFGYVGLAAWLAVVPREAWDLLGAHKVPACKGPGASSAPESCAARWACLAAGTVALVSLVHDVTPWRHTPLPRPIRSLINIPCMHQEWGMFGDVKRQEQWAYARAELANGSVVDLLRGGRPLEAERPTGGFTSLPHHRWHKLFWVLPRAEQRIFAPAIAAALARQWNARHPPSDGVLFLEIRFARLGRTSTDDTLHELLLATWPPRDHAGRGNLERLLDGPEPDIERGPDIDRQANETLAGESTVD
jgi:hypothetical protein